MCFEKVPCMAIYIVKMGVWNGSKTMWDSFQSQSLVQKTCLSKFLEPYMRAQVCVYVCMHHGRARRLVLACVG